VNGSSQTGVNFAIPSGASYGISGTISGGAGAAVTLSGPINSSTVADGSGNYAFTGLVNGSYTVTPSQSGASFTPASQPVTVNGADMPGIDFAGNSVPASSVSGSIIPAGAGITVNLTGPSNGSTVTDSAGNYSFGGLATGNYVLTPSQSGYSFTPESLNVTVAGGNLTGQDFTRQQSANGTLAIDAKVSHDNAAASATIATPPFATGAANELLLAFSQRITSLELTPR
jgi:hypothetical protein